MANWLGMTVYHPMFQLGDQPYWCVADYPPQQAEEAENPFMLEYDKGVIVSYEGDEVTFQTDFGSLHYPPTNLWYENEGY